MLKDCLEIFEAELERTKKRFGDSDRLILDEYILADGDYLVVERTVRSDSVQSGWIRKPELLRESQWMISYMKESVFMIIIADW